MLSTVRKMAVPGKMAQWGEVEIVFGVKKMALRQDVGRNPRPRRTDGFGEDGRGHVGSRPR
jgi:hypothetical protein